jgi:hypothetical protein
MQPVKERPRHSPRRDLIKVFMLEICFCLLLGPEGIEALIVEVNRTIGGLGVKISERIKRLFVL